MDDPQRLVDDPRGSSLARALLASAQADAPSARSRARIARRLGIAAVLAGGTGLGSEAGALAVTYKLAAVVLALGGIVGLAVWQSPPSPPAAGPPAAIDPSRGPSGASRSAASPPPPPPAPPAPPAPAPIAESPAPEVPAATVAPAPAPARRTPAPAPAITTPPASPVAEKPAAVVAEPLPDPASTEPAVETAPALPPAASPSRLAEEVALVDRARSRLAAGDHRAARAALAEYHQRFAPGDLDAEADVVMIEILISAGDGPRARALGASFLQRFPRSPLVQRVHSLLERLPN